MVPSEGTHQRTTIKEVIGTALHQLSKAYYEKIPLGLQLILNLNSEKKMMDGLLLLLEEGYESISSLLTESMNPCHWKNHFDEMEHKIKGLIVTAKELASPPHYFP